MVFILAVQVSVLETLSKTFNVNKNKKFGKKIKLNKTRFILKKGKQDLL